MPYNPNFDPVRYAHFRMIRLRILAAYFAFGFFGASLLFNFVLLLLQGFAFHGFSLPTAMLATLGAATIGQVAGVLFLTQRFLFPADGATVKPTKEVRAARRAEIAEDMPMPVSSSTEGSDES